MDLDELELSKETIKELEKAREEYKKGNVHSLKDIKKELKTK